MATAFRVPKRRTCELLYIEGPGDIVASFDSWRRGELFANETSVTYSSQFFEHCSIHDLTFTAVSYGGPPGIRRGPKFVVSNSPRAMLRIPKIGYDLSLLWYACRIAWMVATLRPKTTLVTAGVMRWWACRWLGRLGTDVVPILHNGLWANGFPVPTKARELRWWRDKPPMTFVVSPAIRRQLISLNPACRVRTVEFRPTFIGSEFSSPAHVGSPGDSFRILFVGRLEENKGALDLVDLASRMRSATSSPFEIEVCGDGSAAAEIDSMIDRLSLRSHVKRLGRLPRRELVERYAAADVCIVPTRSTFSEGFAQVVAEAILLGCPVVTNKVVPAAELYPNAILLARTDDIESYAAILQGLMHDSRQLARLRAACASYRDAILDRSLSFQRALSSLS